MPMGTGLRRSLVLASSREAHSLDPSAMRFHDCRVIRSIRNLQLLGMCIEELCVILRNRKSRVFGTTTGSVTGSTPRHLSRRLGGAALPCVSWLCELACVAEVPLGAPGRSGPATTSPTTGGLHGVRWPQRGHLCTPAIRNPPQCAPQQTARCNCDSADAMSRSMLWLACILVKWSIKPFVQRRRFCGHHGHLYSPRSST